MGLYFKDLKVPTDCRSCNMRDVEYGDNCCLMPADYFDTFERQYECCPIKALMKLCSGITLPPHGDLISKDATIDAILDEPDEESYPTVFAQIVEEMPVTIPASK